MALRLQHGSLFIMADFDVRASLANKKLSWRYANASRHILLRSEKVICVIVMLRINVDNKLHAHQAYIKSRIKRSLMYNYNYLRCMADE